MLLARCRPGGFHRQHRQTLLRRDSGDADRPMLRLPAYPGKGANAANAGVGPR